MKRNAGTQKLGQIRDGLESARVHSGPARRLVSDQYVRVLASEGVVHVGEDLCSMHDAFVRNSCCVLEALRGSPPMRLERPIQVSVRLMLRRLWRPPHPAMKNAPETRYPPPSDFLDSPVQVETRGQRAVGEAPPQIGVIRVVIAVDEPHGDPSSDQRIEDLLRGRWEFEVAQEHHCSRFALERKGDHPAEVTVRITDEPQLGVGQLKCLVLNHSNLSF